MSVAQDYIISDLPSHEKSQEPQPTAQSPSKDTSIAAIYTEESEQPHKVHIRGLDDLTTENIREFALEHFPTAKPSRIEWIDDTSANIVYSTPALAGNALTALTAQPDDAPLAIPTLQLRSAKHSSAVPNANLEVRLAVLSDQKKARAAEASRFYLMHPEHDPRERLRQEFADRRRGGRRGGRRQEGRGGRFDDDELARRKDRDADEGFEASMYDDDAGARASRRQPNRGQRRNGSKSSYSADDDGDDLFANKRSKSSSLRLRNRSASPGRNFSDDEGALRDRSSRGRRFRDRSPPPRYRSRDPNPYPRDNFGKELLPIKTTSTAAMDSVAPRKTLAPIAGQAPVRNRSAASNLKKELFPNKTAVSNHRRSDAFDAADETADLFASNMSVPFMDGSSDSATPKRNLADRLSRQDNGISIRGAAADSGISIRGAAAAGNGFSIKGAAAGHTTNSVKELFPGKFGRGDNLGSNAGKELFGDRLNGGGRRKKAEDLFY